jgi:hypothetical protein
LGIFAFYYPNSLAMFKEISKMAMPGTVVKSKISSSGLIFSTGSRLQDHFGEKLISFLFLNKFYSLIVH